MPVQIIGLTAVPDAGDAFHVVESERVAKDIVAHRESRAARARRAADAPRLTLDELFAPGRGRRRRRSSRSC